MRHGFLTDSPQAVTDHDAYSAQEKALLLGDFPGDPHDHPRHAQWSYDSPLRTVYLVAPRRHIADIRARSLIGSAHWHAFFERASISVSLPADTRMQSVEHAIRTMASMRRGPRLWRFPIFWMGICSQTEIQRRLNHAQDFAEDLV